MWFITPGGSMYQGDLQPGDRAATEQEIADRLASLDNEAKRKILAAAMDKRDKLLTHLYWFYTKAKEGVPPAELALAQAVGEAAVEAATAALAAANAKVLAINAAVLAFHDMFNDPAIVAATDGAADPAIRQCYERIGETFAAAAPETCLAILALDPL